MRIRWSLLISAGILASLLGPVAPAHAGDRRSTSAAPEGANESARAIVGVAAGHRSEAADLIEDEGGDVVGYSRPGAFFVVETSSDPAAWAQDVEGAASVRYAEPDRELSAEDLFPTDPSWDKLWGLRQIAAPAAWETAAGAGEVVVGVIDSGVDYSHEDLAARMWVNPDEDPATAADDDNNGWKNDIHGVDCANEDADPADDNGHGTHVAGTIGAAANNSKGIAGVAPNVKIMALKFLGADGTGYTSDAIQCLYYAIQNGAHITNNSWGGSDYSKTLHDAIRYAGSRNQLFIAAAGNEATNIDLAPRYPSSYDVANVISVAATDRADGLAGFSNYGSSVDLGAPGTGILSTVPGGYASYSGTSMAAPHVAGAAALLVGADPSLGGDAARLRAAILDNVDPVPSLAGRTATGGRLNLARAVWPERPVSVHVHDVTRSTKRVSKRTSKVTLTFTIATDREEGAGGAQLLVGWSAGDTSSCTTTSAGTCSVARKVATRSAGKLTATSISVVHASLRYERGADHAS